MARWAAAARLPMGAVVPLETLWELARLWYGDRLAPDWHRRTTAESQVIFDRVGLTDPFWRLAP